MHPTVLAKIEKAGVADFFHILGNNPHIFHPLFDMAMTLWRNSHFDMRQREIIILRIASIRDSKYELYHHNTLAWTAGISQKDVEKITSGDLLEEESDNVLLKTIDALVENKEFDNTEFLEHFNVDQLSYVTAYIGFYIWLDTYTKALDLEIGQKEWKK
jgi:alkylhydroperoxidase family enzyme